jgi:hypothetical protein
MKKSEDLGKSDDEKYKNAYTYMSNIRETAAYFKKSLGDLIAFVSNLGPPHWFITLSANDLNWEGLIRTLYFHEYKKKVNDEDFKNISIAEKRKLLKKYPVIAARYFTKRFKAFILWMKASNSIGGK